MDYFFEAVEIFEKCLQCVGPREWLRVRRASKALRATIDDRRLEHLQSLPPWWRDGENITLADTHSEAVECLWTVMQIWGSAWVVEFLSNEAWGGIPPDEERRVTIMQALGQVGDSEKLAECFGQFLSDDDAIRRSTALDALGKLGEQHASQFTADIVRLLRDPDADVRYEATETVGRLGKHGVEFIGDVAMRLDDHEWSVRCQALEAMSRFSEHAEPYMLHISFCLDDSSLRVRDIAAETLGKLIVAQVLRAVASRQSGEQCDSSNQNGVNTVRKNEMLQRLGFLRRKVTQFEPLTHVGIVETALLDDLKRQIMELEVDIHAAHNVRT